MCIVDDLINTNRLEKLAPLVLGFLTTLADVERQLIREAGDS